MPFIKKFNKRLVLIPLLAVLLSSCADQQKQMGPGKQPNGAWLFLSDGDLPMHVFAYGAGTDQIRAFVEEYPKTMAEWERISVGLANRHQKLSILIQYFNHVSELEPSWDGTGSPCSLHHPVNKCSWKTWVAEAHVVDGERYFLPDRFKGFQTRSFRPNPEKKKSEIVK